MKRLMHRSKQQLFDHLVGSGQQRWWQVEVERSGGLEVEDQIVFRRLLDWQIGWLFAFEGRAARSRKNESSGFSQPPDPGFQRPATAEGGASSSAST